MAQILKANGDIIENVMPQKGKHFSLKEMQEIVDGYIEILDLQNGKLIILNEEGKLEGLPYNMAATIMYRSAYMTYDYIVGDVLVCDKNQIR